MISCRNYLAVVMLMIVLMFLLMASSVLRDWWNDYTVNEYTGSGGGNSSDINAVWHNSAGRSTAGSAVLIGRDESVCGKTAEEWAAYSRRDFARYASLQTYRAEKTDENKPEMLIIDSAYVDWNEEDTAYLTDCVEQGVNLVFCTLPDASVIKDSEPLRELLGIKEISAEQKEAAGLYLSAGFLLGGEQVYLPPENTEEDDNDKRKIVFPGNVSSDGSPVFDWYLLGPGTKIYMRGIPEEEGVQNGEYPALIWRKSFGTAYVFAVNGGYMEGAEGMGILAAMAAEMHPYEIYPVVNAQNMILLNYPVLADENREEMERLYSRSAKDVYQEILWSSIWRIIHPYGYKVTCMMSPQLDYSDGVYPDTDQLEYYLKLFNEASAEAGLSLVSVSDTPIEQKVEEDEQFFKGTADYDFSSVYAGEIPNESIEGVLGTELLSSVVTAVKKYGGEEDGKIIDLLNENVTSQASFDTDFGYTYKQDFQFRCLQTALGYTNILYDMGVVAYPRSDDDAWEKLSPEFKTSVDGYGRLFPAFDKTTASECSERVRTFLTAQYTDSREGDTIRIETRGAENTKWFILRIHNETIEQMDGGSWTKVEDGAYLIAADADEVSIQLKPDGSSARQ